MSLNLKHLKKVWAGFNHWRKRYWFTRTLVILILFTPILYEKLSGNIIICDLIRIACDGIFASSIPKSEFALCRFYKFQEKRRLQAAIIHYTDKNQNGVLEFKEIVNLYDMGCDVDEIEKSPTELDLDKLAYNAGILGLLTPSYSTKEVRIKAFNAAHAESDFFYTPLTNEVYDIIDRQNWLIPRFTEKQIAQLKLYHSEEALSNGTLIPDYTKWGTWKYGIHYFKDTIFWTFYPFSALVPWFSLSILFSLFVALYTPRYKKVLGILASLAFLGLVLHMNAGIELNRFYGTNLFWHYFSYIAFVFSLICFSLIAGLTGFKISKFIKNKKVWRVFVLFAIGIVLFWRNCGILGKNSWGWYNDCVGDFVRPSSYFDHNSVYNEIFFISVIIMIISIIMGFRYWIDYKTKKHLEKDKR